MNIADGTLISSYWEESVKNTGKCQSKEREGDQWNRIEDSELNPHNSTQSIFDNDFQKHRMENRILFSKWYCTSTESKMKLDPCLSLCTKINSKPIKYLNLIKL